MSLADASLLSLLYKLLKVNIFGVFSLTAFPALCVLLYSVCLKPMKHLYLEGYEILMCGSIQTLLVLPLDHTLGESVTWPHSIVVLCLLLKADKLLALQN